MDHVLRALDCQYFLAADDLEAQRVRAQADMALT